MRIRSFRQGFDQAATKAVKDVQETPAMIKVDKKEEANKLPRVKLWEIPLQDDQIKALSLRDTFSCKSASLTQA